MPKISQFWLDRLAGKPLSPAWAAKEAREAAAWWSDTPLPSIRAAVRRGDVPDDALPMRAWKQLPLGRQRAITQVLFRTREVA